MSNPKSLTVIAVIAAVVALGPLSTDMYLPSFPALVAAFSSDSGQVQLTLSVYLVGFAIGQLLYGPLSDRFGRKPLLIGGLLLFLLGSLGAAFADSIESLILMRLLQALGGAAGPVLGRAMIRDIHGPLESARLLSYIGTAMALAPAVAPIIGGYMTLHLGWQSIFLFLALYALFSILMLILQVPESLPADNHQGIHPRALLHSYATLLRHPSWRWYTLCCSFVFAGLFSFLSGAPFVIIDFLGYREEQFGLFFTLIVIGYMIGTLLAGRLVRQIGFDRLIGYGALLSAVGGGVMALLAMLEVHSVWAIIVPHMVYMVGTGIVMPQAMAGALAPFPHIAGSSSALLGFVQMALAAGVGVWVGHTGDGSPRVMALSIGLMGVLTLASQIRLKRTLRLQPETT